MGVFRFAAFILPMILLIACGGDRTPLSTEDERTPLHRAAADNDLQAVVFLLDQGVDIEARDEQGMMPLHFAVVDKRTPEVVALLLDRGADVKARNSDGMTPLHFAAGSGTVPEVIALLLDRGADVEARNDVRQIYLGWAGLFKRTLLLMAAFSLDMFELSLDGELDPEESLVAHLLDGGVDIETSVGGWTPLHFATAASTMPEVIALLLDRGSDIEARSATGLTPLHFAARWSNTPEVVALLLERGANIKARDKFGNTPFYYAEENEHLRGTGLLKRLEEVRSQ